MNRLNTTWLTALCLAALLSSPLAASQHMSPPAFADIDSNGDGMIDPEEFAQHQATRMAERHGGQAGQGKSQGAGQGQGKGQGQGQGQGKGQGQGQGKGHGHGKGHQGPPAYGDLDLDGNGCIDADEFSKHVAERHGAASG